MLIVEAIQEIIICRYNKKGGNEQKYYINKEASKSQIRIVVGHLRGHRIGFILKYNFEVF